MPPLRPILALLCLLAILIAAAPVWAADGGCPEPAATMRRTHMDLLRHDRDLAVHQGVRRPGHGINECIGCHVARDAAGQAIPATETRHFCVGCHRSAAVSIDCFTCHRATPVPVPAGAAP